MWIPLTTLMIWPSSSCRVVWFIPLLGSFCASYSMLTGSWITLRTILISSLYLRLKPWRECQAWEEARVCFKLIGLTFGFCVILVSTYIKGWNVTGFSKTMNNGLGNFSIPSRLKNKKASFPRVGCFTHIQSNRFLPVLFGIQMQFLELENSPTSPTLPPTLPPA